MNAENKLRLQPVVGWRLWHVGNRRWLWGGRQYETRAEADRAKVTATRGRRNALTNWLRICARVVSVRADGSSPMRDDIQRQWDSKMKTPANDRTQRPPT